MINSCRPDHFDAIVSIINEASVVYRGVIPPDCWHEPYMSREDLRREIDAGVAFRGFFDGDTLAGVMGLQHVDDVSLIRHAYTRTAVQGRGIGTALLTSLQQETDRPVLIGTWKAATWAIKFYEGRGFRLVDPIEKDKLLQRYWTVPPRQTAESVVLVDHRWTSLSS